MLYLSCKKIKGDEVEVPSKRILARITAQDIRAKYGLKLTMPLAVWADEATESIALSYKDCARKGSYRSYAREIVKYFPMLSEEYIAEKCRYYARYQT